MNVKAMKPASVQDNAGQCRASDLQVQVEALQELSHIAQKWHLELLKVKQYYAQRPGRKTASS